MKVGAVNQNEEEENLEDGRGTRHRKVEREWIRKFSDDLWRSVSFLNIKRSIPKEKFLE